MKAEPILQELEATKERLATEAGGDSQRFLEEMEGWLAKHPHKAPMVNSPEELQERLRAREATESTPPRGKPYRVHDPIKEEEGQKGTAVLIFTGLS